jgi:multicomponent Na+:H+ antiporter subunit G
MMLDAFTGLMVVAGAFLFMAGTVGLLRFPDKLSRLHALTKVDNLGLGLIVAGLIPQGGVLLALKLVCAWLLVQLSGAIVTQLIGSSVRDRDRP